MTRFIIGATSANKRRDGIPAIHGLTFPRFFATFGDAMATIAIIGTLDTKGHEHAFVAEQIRLRGHTPLLIDVGTLGPPQVDHDIKREEIATAVEADLAAIAERKDRGEAVKAMSEGAPVVISRLHAEGRIGGVISLGGSGGTAIATAAMRALPIGFPKLMVSTMASGNTAPYVDVKDITMMPSIVDVAGLNSVSRQIFANAAGAICGMVETKRNEGKEDKPIIAASMFGNTTECVAEAQKILEAAGYEVLVFHATGTGGRTMESLIDSGMVAGVLDVTTTEWADELVGGVLSAGPTRLEAAAKGGVPAVVAPGCLDMANFGGPETIPEKYKDRLFYEHNPQVTLMRTSPGECAELGGIIAEKLNASTGLVSVLIPTEAISVISAEGQAFHDPEADRALFNALTNNLKPEIPATRLPIAINDPEFAKHCANELVQLIESSANTI